MNTETKVETTPAPWEEGVMQIINRKDDKNYRFIKAGEGYWSDKNTGFHLTGYMSPADSRMISAAPDMLEALEQILSDANSADYEGSFSEASHIKAKEAINKARGL